MIAEWDLTTDEPVVVNLGREDELPFRRIQAFVRVTGWTSTVDGTLTVTFEQAGTIR